MNKDKVAGFTLVELLVVIAIVGVLAYAGIVSYKKYIDTSKANVMAYNREGMINQIMKEDAYSRTPQGTPFKDCFSLIDSVVLAQDQGGAVNSFTGGSYPWLNGHRELYAQSSLPPVTWKQGQQLVMCDNPNIDLDDPAGNNIAICSCSTSTCMTSASGTYSADSNSCPTPNFYKSSTN